ncbi:hypothetical protein GCM10023235_03250 [Kitasatospora terrestris]|uniref:DUF5937 domain-containing protein n=1 Tax=Kitasatospora terrestris TaxID=258051 RepID=A0ABP9D774_9ACTN
MTLTIDITGLPAERLRFTASPLAELTSMLHVLAEPGHHPRLAGWAAETWAALRPELAERLREAEFLWRSSRADFLVPARPRPTLAQELDDLDLLDDDAYATAALVTTCGSNRVRFGAGLGTGSPLTDPAARDRALVRAQARGALQEAFAERLLADPAAVRARVRHTLELCGEAFFDTAWGGITTQLATDLRLKNDLLRHQGIGPALTSVSGAVALSPDGTRILVDKLQDNATSAHGSGVTFIPSVFGSPHLVVVSAPGWQPVVQYPVAEPRPPAPRPPADRRTAPRSTLPPRPAAPAAHPRPRPPHHRRTRHRLGPHAPRGLPPPRPAPPRRPAHHPAARTLRQLHPRPRRADRPRQRPAHRDAALTAPAPPTRGPNGCAPRPASHRLPDGRADTSLDGRVNESTASGDAAPEPGDHPCPNPPHPGC